MREIFPELEPRHPLAELIAMMSDGVQFAHIGYHGDHEIIDGCYPMHWVVRCGQHIYDPTFWQMRMRNVKTPLRLPPEPYLFVEHWFTHADLPGATDREGFAWVVDSGTPSLKIGYCMRRNLLPDHVQSDLMNDIEAAKHARHVVDIFHAND